MLWRQGKFSGHISGFCMNHPSYEYQARATLMFLYSSHSTKFLPAHQIMSDLIAADLNPVPFSPYFTLTYSWFVSYDRKSLENPPIPLPPDVRQPKQKTEDFTVERLFGGMRKMSDDTQAQFLLMLMKHTDIDWSAACKEAAKARKIRPVSKV